LKKFLKCHIRNTLKVRQKYFYSHSSKYYVSNGGIAQRPAALISASGEHIIRDNFPHSHLRLFPLLPIPILTLESNSHSHGTPMEFPFPLGRQFPQSSLQPAIDHYDAVSTFHDDDLCEARLAMLCSGCLELTTENCRYQ